VLMISHPAKYDSEGRYFLKIAGSNADLVIHCTHRFCFAATNAYRR
ncbi:unnamed protein product, partial [Acidithrix sp. C25]